ncbi:hypothetical protein QF042_000750 [Pedobacter sp. W3I1]|nr:hypothetical protein [Pedobacter sp. W3I1]
MDDVERKMYDGKLILKSIKPSFQIQIHFMDYGLWTMDYGLWTMDYGLWTMDYVPTVKNSRIIHYNTILY